VRTTVSIYHIIDFTEKRYLVKQYFLFLNYLYTYLQYQFLGTSEHVVYWLETLCPSPSEQDLNPHRLRWTHGRESYSLETTRDETHALN
jgi:hypothetical protein